jgi:tRNA threonylcarbamoyladenosine biosynthesis protein TsaE
MNKKEIRQWKKVLLSDLSYVAFELKEVIEKPSVIILNGIVGAGKTTFVKSFLEDSKVTSPTYSVINETVDAVYADFYRLKDISEISALEIPLYLEGKNYFLVEWGEKFLRPLTREIPEEFNFYFLDIVIHQPISPEQSEARDFFLFSLKFD